MRYQISERREKESNSIVTLLRENLPVPENIISNMCRKKGLFRSGMRFFSVMYLSNFRSPVNKLMIDHCHI